MSVDASCIVIYLNIFSFFIVSPKSLQINHFYSAGRVASKSHNFVCSVCVDALLAYDMLLEFNEVTN